TKSQNRLIPASKGLTQRDPTEIPRAPWDRSHSPLGLRWDIPPTAGGIVLGSRWDFTISPWDLYLHSFIVFCARRRPSKMARAVFSSILLSARSVHTRMMAS